MRKNRSPDSSSELADAIAFEYGGAGGVSGEQDLGLGPLGLRDPAHVVCVRLTGIELEGGAVARRVHGVQSDVQ